jgi:hypothetical protein
MVIYFQRDQAGGICANEPSASAISLKAKQKRQNRQKNWFAGVMKSVRRIRNIAVQENEE